MKKKWLKILCCTLSAAVLLVLLLLASCGKLYGGRGESEAESASEGAVSSSDGSDASGDGPSAVSGIEEWNEFEDGSGQDFEENAESAAVNGGSKGSETGAVSRPSESASDPAEDSDAAGESNGESSKAESDGEALRPENSESRGPQSPSSDAASSSPVSGQGPSAEGQAMSFEAYLALTPHQQQEFYWEFETPEAFLDWYDAAKAKYEESVIEVEVNSNGTIDIGGIIEEQNGKNDG